MKRVLDVDHANRCSAPGELLFKIDGLDAVPVTFEEYLEIGEYVRATINQDDVFECEAMEKKSQEIFVCAGKVAVPVGILLSKVYKNSSDPGIDEKPIIDSIDSEIGLQALKQEFLPLGILKAEYFSHVG